MTTGNGNGKSRGLEDRENSRIIRTDGDESEGQRTVLTDDSSGKFNKVRGFFNEKRHSKPWSAVERFFVRTYRALKIDVLAKYISNWFSSQSHHTIVVDPPGLKSATRKAFGYAEAHRLREKITNDLKEKKQKILVVTSPHDGTGNTFLVTVLGLNAVRFSNMNVLIVDMNMRCPQIHNAFDLSQNKGFTDVIKRDIHWRDSIKDTDFKQLQVITAGEYDFELARHLNRPNIEGLINEIKDHYDFIIIDTSPVLSQNRNNVDPTLLSIICDKVLIQIQGKKTTKAELAKAFAAITEGGGKVDGVVYNKQY